MNRDGQIWLDHGDDDSPYLVVDGPRSNDFGVTYVMLDLAKGNLCEWSKNPSWESDCCLTRIT